MRVRPVLFTATCIMLISWASAARSQVMENHSLARESKRAISLLAGVQAGDLPQHVHYDLKLYDRKGKMSTASYDVYRDPQVYVRIDASAGDFHFSSIESYYNHRRWSHQSGLQPLKLLDFEEVFVEPIPALERLLRTKPQPQLHLGKFNGAPLLCASDNAGTTLCFDPLVHVFAWSQTFNQTVMYSDWQPIGTHSVPCDIRIYEGKHLLVEARGSVKEVKKFPTGLFVVPPGESSEPDGKASADAGAHKILRYGRASSNPALVYGNVLLRLTVDQKGRVKKARVIDSDDKKLEGAARHYAKEIRYQPYLVNGQPQPFETTLVFHHFPPPA